MAKTTSKSGRASRKKSGVKASARAKPAAKKTAKKAATKKPAKKATKTATTKATAKATKKKRGYQQKTLPTGADVRAFISRVDGGPERRADCEALVALMERATGEPPRMWGTSIVGFGSHHYRYASGHEGDTCIAGFSPRKAALTLYLLPGFTGREELMQRLGKHATGKGCLYIKRLADVDMAVLEELLRESARAVRQLAQLA